MTLLRKIALYLIPSLLSTSLYSQALTQQWLRTFSGQGKNPDRANQINVDNNGNIVIAGYASGVRAFPDMFAMKYNSLGDTMWVYYYNGPGSNEDYVYDMAVDHLGNVYLTGSVSNANYWDECTTIKLDSNGVEQWVNRYIVGTGGDSHGNGVAVDSSGNVYVAGYFDAPASSPDWLVIKYSPSGQVLWTDVSNSVGSVSDEANDIAIGPNQQATACGMSAITGGGGYNFFVKQYTTTGGTAWTASYTNPNAVSGIDKALKLSYASNGDILVAGQSDNGTTNDEALVISYSPTGVQNWATVYTDANTNLDDQIHAMAIDDSGNTYLTGLNFQSQIVYRINANGSQGWRKIWRGPIYSNYNVAFGIAVDNNGGVYTTGKGVYPGPDYTANGGMNNMTIAKYSTNGDSLWTYRSFSNTDLSLGFAITTKNGKVYGAGFRADTAYIDENFYTLIVDTAGNFLTEWDYSGQGASITRGQFVKTDALNNVYCAATIDRQYNNGFDVAVIKYDPAGTLLWEKYYTTPGWANDTLTGMEIDPTGNLVLSISSDTGGVSAAYRLSLVKMDQYGNFLDTAWYLPSPLGSTHATSMQVRSDGSIVLGANSNIKGGLMVYFDPSWNFQWAAQMDSTQFTVTKVNSIATFSNNDIAVTGYVQPSSGTTRKIVVQRLDPSGNRLWSTDIDSANVPDEGIDITISALGKVAITGSSGAAAVVAQLDGANGQLLWRTIYNATASTAEYGVKARYTPNGSVAIICRGWSGFVARYFTAQFNGTTGIKQWEMVYSQTASDREPVDLLVEPNGRVITAGWQITAASSNYDYVLVGYNSTGVQQFLNTYTSPNYHAEFLRDLARDTQGNFIITGETEDDFLNNYLYKILTIKYGGSAVGFEEINNTTANVKAYPNPSGDGKFFFMDLSQSAPLTGARVFDTSGRMIQEYKNFNGEDEIDLSSFPPGLYLFQFDRYNIPSGTIRLVKN